ncbi:hypothetical protein PMAYCL1PPCAC_02886 [Pristionchus mayeri]|uniref:Uncharacterized protein n=1 Tax=Pristionchus mayeri TaxID=1317129 RepID=A0AAN5C8X3_9BILA|nr:hypothetical protein PMAYCL1PPCAC_02886 [Pristionchus mayeri]
MGRRSPSPRRRRSRSRERRRSRSRERRDDKKDRQRDDKEKAKKSTTQGILEAKKHMRDSLKSAASSISYDVPTASNVSVEDDSGGMSRARSIAEIDSDGFKQRTFKSSGGGAGGRVYAHKDERKKAEKLEEVHDSIIFGPTSRPTANQKEEEIDEIAQLLKEEPRDLFPEICYEDKESRQARWLALYNERRRHLHT